MENTSFNIKNNREINLDSYGSVLATQPAAHVSSRYKFIPTTQALAVLADYGWFPTQVDQARVNKAENQGFQKHLIRLNNERFSKEMVVGSTIPQIMLGNSHNGGGAYTLSVGIFEGVCSNGLCVSRGNWDSIRITHSGYKDIDLANAIENMVKVLPDVMKRTDDFKQIRLTHDEEVAYASAAIELRFDGDKYAVSPEELLRTHRSAEREPTLWNTFNKVQEKVVRGGVRQVRSNGSRIQSREVKNIQANRQLNEALWTLTEKMAELKMS